MLYKLPWMRNDHGRAALLVSLTVLVFYARALGVGILSDGYYILGHASGGPLHALSWDHSYHYYPVANLFFALLWKAFGTAGLGYQALNLVQLAANGWLLYRLGSRLSGEPGVGLLAGCLFVANSSFYEVPCWPINGNLHSLAATFTLLGLWVLLAGVESGRTLRGGWLFALFVLAAFCTYEPTVTMTVSGAVWLAWLEADRRGEGLVSFLRRRSSWWWLARRLAPAAGAALLGIAVRQVMMGPDAPIDTAGNTTYWFRGFLLVRGLIAVFTLTAPEHLLFRLFSLGGLAGWETAAFFVALVGWLLVAAVVTAVVLARSRWREVRLALVWLVVHFGVLHVVTPVTSRHFLIPALPAALISAAGLTWAWRTARARLASAADARARRRWRVALAAIVTGPALALGASYLYAQRATHLHLEATAATASVVEEIRAGLAARPDAQALLLLNMDAVLAKDGLGAFTFINGLHQLVGFTFPGQFQRIELGYHERLGGTGHWANASQPIGLGEINRRIGRRNWVVVRFDRATKRAKLLMEPIPRETNLPRIP